MPRVRANVRPVAEPFPARRPDALAAPHHMTVSLDSTTVLSFDVDLAAELNLAPDGTAWVGFTAGTGSLAAALDIVSWSFCPVAA